MSLIRYQFPELSHWAPRDRFSLLSDEVNRLFDLSWPSREGPLFQSWSPALDVYDDKDNLVVNVELPGLPKDAIEISLREGVLTVSGERKHEREGQDGATFRSERTFGKFQRSVTLPTRVKGDQVTASFQDGILSIVLPKADDAKPKQIAINVS